MQHTDIHIISGDALDDESNPRGINQGEEVVIPKADCRNLQVMQGHLYIVHE